ncbi:MAG: glycosyltransferase [Verrucomicrobiales bacterium]|nr:glycosyltransferase [Verrucomicrobiales bacterium]
MNRLRILQLFNRYLLFGGEEGCVSRIGTALRQLYEVEDFSYGIRELLRGRNEIPWAELPAFLYNREIAARLAHRQREGKFDVWLVHNVFPAMSPSAYRVAFELQVPIVHYLHNYRLSCVNGFYLNHGQLCQRCITGNFTSAFLTKCWHHSRWQSGYMGAIIASIRSKLFERVAHWIAISEFQKEEHVKMGIPRENISVIRHFYEPDCPPVDFSQARHALFVGRLSPEKGVDVLLRAWRLLAPRGRKLFIVGDGPERAALQRYCADHHLREVVFTGFLSRQEQREIWAKSLFSVVPSVWYEPFGMVVLEAWANGRAPIVHDIGGLAELIDHGVTGWRCPPGNEAQLAAQMETLFSRPELEHTAGGGAFNVLLERYNRRCWLDEIGAVYQRFKRHPLTGRRRFNRTADGDLAVSAPAVKTKPVLLVFEFYQLGDGILSLPFLRGALERYRVVVCCSPNVAELYSVCLPEMETLVYQPFWRDWRGNGIGISECIRQMRALRPEVAASILPDPRIQCLMVHSGAAERVGFRTDDQNIWSPAYLRWRRVKVLSARLVARLWQRVSGSEWLTRELERGKPTRAQWKSWRQLAETLAVPWRDEFPWFMADGEVPLAVNNFLSRARAERRAVLMVHTGARNASRRWPREHFAAVIDKYLRDNDSAVIVTDSGKNNLPAVSSPWCLAWQSRGLREFFAVLSRVDVILGNDSFPVHAAAALGKRVYTIFSAQDAEWFAPYGNEHRVIQKDVCRFRPCLDYCKQPAYICLDAVTPDDVMKKLAADHRAAEI